MSNGKYREATKNNCPTGWYWAIEKSYVVCSEMYTTEGMRAMAEFYGSLFLALFLVGGTAAYNSYTGSVADPMYAPFANFFVPFVHYAGLFVVQASIFAVFGTGNPSLSIVFGIAGKYRWMDVLYSVLMSTLGWFLATILLRLFYFPTATIVASIPVLQPGVSEGFGFAVELFAAFAWGLTIFFHIGKPNQDQMVATGLFSAMAISWPLTRAALNPHRVLGPLLGISFWDTSLWQQQLWVYAFAHFVGFLLAYGAYYTGFAMMEDKCKKQEAAKQKACPTAC